MAERTRPVLTRPSVGHRCPMFVRLAGSGRRQTTESIIYKEARDSMQWMHRLPEDSFVQAIHRLHPSVPPP